MKKTKIYQMRAENTRVASAICDRIRREVFPDGLERVVTLREGECRVTHKLTEILAGRRPVGS